MCEAGCAYRRRMMRMTYGDKHRACYVANGQECPFYGPCRNSATRTYPNLAVRRAGLLMTRISGTIVEPP